MNGWIAQIFHSFTGKGIISDGSRKDRASRSDRLLKRAGPEPEISGAGRPGMPEAVKTVDRKEFEKTVNERIKSADCRGCLLVSDVDRYKKLGSIYGRDAADAVLARVREMLCGISDTDGRTGCSDKDRFILWLPEEQQDAVSGIRRRIGEVNDRLLHPQGGIPPATVSVGIAFCQAGDDCRSLMKKAYKALCTVKESGRCGCEFM